MQLGMRRLLHIVKREYNGLEEGSVNRGNKN